MQNLSGKDIHKIALWASFYTCFFFGIAGTGFYFWQHGAGDWTGGHPSAPASIEKFTKSETPHSAPETHASPSTPNEHDDLEENTHPHDPTHVTKTEDHAPSPKHPAEHAPKDAPAHAKHAPTHMPAKHVANADAHPVVTPKHHEAPAAHHEKHAQPAVEAPKPVKAMVPAKKKEAAPENALEALEQQLHDTKKSMHFGKSEESAEEVRTPANAEAKAHADGHGHHTGAPKATHAPDPAKAETHGHAPVEHGAHH